MYLLEPCSATRKTESEWIGSQQVITISIIDVNIHIPGNTQEISIGNCQGILPCLTLILAYPEYRDRRHRVCLPGHVFNIPHSDRHCLQSQRRHIPNVCVSHSVSVSVWPLCMRRSRHYIFGSNCVEVKQISNLYWGLGTSLWPLELG
jgi:hypothetical protein